jgi:heme exporter protein D
MKASGFSEFLAMGGYGFYVWTSYVVAAIAVVVEIISVRSRIRAAVKSASIPERGVVLPDDTQ